MIKHLAATDYNQVVDLWKDTFLEDGPELVSYYFDQHIEMNQVIGMVEENELYGMLHLNPYQLMWHGALYNTSYVVGVATSKRHRRKGIMRQLIEWTLKTQYANGEIFSVLMPIDSRYYDQFGYGFIQDVILYKFYYNRLNRKPRTVPSKEITKETSIELLPIYNQYKKQFDLIQNRGMKSYENLLEEVHSEDGHIVLVPDGYVIYYNFENQLFVRETCYTSSMGLMNILDYIGQISNEQLIEWQMPKVNPLEHLIPHLEGHTRTYKPFMMVRIINVKALLQDMANQIGPCKIKVTDPYILENNRTYRVGDDVTETMDDPDILIDIESLAQWLFGYATLEALAFVRDTVIINNDVVYYPESPILNYFNEFI